MTRTLACAVLLAAASVASSHAGAQLCRVPESQIAHWMSAESTKGYDLLSTANGVRLQSAVILGLVRNFKSTDPERRRLWMDHDRYFQAFVDVTHVSPDAAPAFVRVARDNGEDVLLDYRAEVVVAAVEKGADPDVTVNVLVGWRGGADSYTYEDKKATPPLRVTHDRISTFRVLTFKDIVVYDAIDGVHGRATGGALGAVFRVLGDGRAVSSRFVLAEDGTQVTRTTARKGPLELTQTATVFPDGRGERGLPRDRDDLRPLEDRLRVPMRLRYVPLDTASMPAAPTEDCG